MSNANGRFSDDLVLARPGEIVRKAWDESKHPRHPSGSAQGGEFAGGGSAEPEPEREPWPIEAHKARLWPEVGAGSIVDGREVLEGVPNMSSIDGAVERAHELGVREVPMSAFSPEYKPSWYSVSEETRTKALAAKIEASKTISPLIVVVDKQGPYILEGGHRFDALHLLGAKSFPALVVLDLDSLASDPRPRVR